MTRTEALVELRSILNCAPTNGLWSEALLMNRMAEGQKKFCARTGFFVDFTNFTLTTEAEVSDYDLDPLIIEVFGIYDATDGRWLGKTRHDFQASNQYKEFPISSQSSTGGGASQWYADKELGLITLKEAPSDVRELTLRVWRYPLIAFNHTTDEAYDGSFEVPDEGQLASIEWAAYRCLSHHDAEAFDPKEAARHLTEFTQLCTEGKRVFRRRTAQSVDVGRNSPYVV